MDLSLISLDYFIKEAYSLEGLGVVEVINMVLESSDIFFFSEFLKIPNVQQLKGTENEGYLDILYIFCYGSYKDYRGRKKFEEKQAKTDDLRKKTVSSLSFGKSAI